MVGKKRLDRRSFLAQVVGGTVGGSVLLVLGADAGATTPEGGGQRKMVVDADPADPAREPPVGALPAPPPPPPPPPPGPSSATDSDSGPSSDPAGRGRGASRRIGRLGNASPGPAPRQSFVICPGHPRCPQ